MFLSCRRLWRNGEKVLTEAVFGCYDTQVSDRKEEADPYGERPPHPLHGDGGDAHGFHAYDALRSKHWFLMRRRRTSALISLRCNKHLKSRGIPTVETWGDL